MLALKIAFIFLSMQLNAHEMTVQNNRLIYKMTYSKNALTFKSTDVDLSMQRTDCNKHIIDRVNAILENENKRPYSVEGLEDSLKVIFDKSTGYESKNSMRGKLLISFFDEMKKMKIEEEMNCSKK